MCKCLPDLGHIDKSPLILTCLILIPIYIFTVLYLIYYTFYLHVTSLVYTHKHNKMFYASLSHKDYDQINPLFNALAIHNGNIEFDVHNINTTLLIGHEVTDCHKDISIQFLYLDPLKKLIKQNKIDIKQPVNLLVDIKSDAKESYWVLHELIKNEYDDIITSWEYDINTRQIIKQQRFINIIITGERDIESILNTPNINELKRYMSVDGRIKDINNTINHEYMPIISDKFSKVFKDCNWMNGYTLNEKDKNRLLHYIEQCRLSKQRLRFWDTVDYEKLWQQLIDLDLQKNVIVINTDKPEKLISFLIRNGY
eukprot:187550_1